MHCAQTFSRPVIRTVALAGVLGLALAGCTSGYDTYGYDDSGVTTYGGAAPYGGTSDPYGGSYSGGGYTGGGYSGGSTGGGYTGGGSTAGGQKPQQMLLEGLRTCGGLDQQRLRSYWRNGLGKRKKQAYLNAVSSGTPVCAVLSELNREAQALGR